MGPPHFVARGSAAILLRDDAGAAEAQATRMTLGRLPGRLASLGAALLGAPATALNAKEPRTGTVFPGELEYCAGKRGCPVVAGTGARTKRLAGIKSLDIYAVGLYVDADAARGALGGAFRGADPGALAADQRLFDELAASPRVAKALRIVITSGLVKQRAFLDALEERLAPPLKAAGELEVLERFKAQFQGAPFRKGFLITFVADGPRLTTRLDGHTVGTIANGSLTCSLLDIYLGASPVSPDGKRSFGRGLAGIVLA